MIILNHEQRSPEWFAARAGLPTASNFDCIVTSKGEQSKQRTKYLYKLAGEAVAGITEEIYTNGAMLRGQELEDEARRLYQFTTDEEVTTCGLCVDFNCGASPDALVGADGLLEIKCPNITTHVEYLLSGKLPTDYIQQVQGQLFITGRKWCDFMSYYPNIKPLIVRVLPDFEFHGKLKQELGQFCLELEQIKERIK